MPELSVLAIPPHLRASYRRLALISDRGQIGNLDLADAETLVVTSDWLAWRRLVEAKGHALHFESMLGSWPEERGDSNLHALDSNRWMLAEGDDVTRFRGVSLGKQFNVQVSRFRHAYLRLWHALDRLCRAYRPREIVLYDLRVEHDFLDPDTTREIVLAVAERNGARVTDRADPQLGRPSAFPVVPFAKAPRRERGLKALAAGAYVGLAHALCRLGTALRPPKPRVFIHHNWLTVKNLLDHADGVSITPVLFARPWPKSLAFAVRCLARGVVLTKLPAVRLDAGDEARLAAMADALGASRSTQASPVDRATHAFVRRHLVDGGWLRARALAVKRVQRLFRDWKIARVLVGDAENMDGRLYVEVAAQLGLAADELPNGIFLNTQRADVRSGEDGRPPPLTRFLAWGGQGEAWLRAARSPVPCLRTGYPALDGFRQREARSNPPRADNRALILPLMVQRHDVRSLYSNTFSSFVELARMLRDLGYGRIRVKIHPGHVAARPYFEEIVRHYRLDCEVSGTGPLDEHIAWADIVVGPLSTGGFVETLAQGKPYYPLRGLPSSQERALFAGATVYDSVEELRQALERGEAPDRAALLQSFCSFADVANASRQVWQALEERLAAEPASCRGGFSRPPTAGDSQPPPSG